MVEANTIEQTQGSCSVYTWGKDIGALGHIEAKGGIVAAKGAKFAEKHLILPTKVKKLT